jgi:hypothetical protein
MLKIWFSLIFLNFFHDFHTSLTELNYNAKTGSLEASVRVFTDDLEMALTMLNEGKKVSMESDPKLLDALISKYIKRNFSLVGPGRQARIGTFYGKEKESDATWIYLEFFDCQNLNGWSVYNTIFTEHFSDQTNLVNVLVQKERKSLLFNTKTKLLAWPF